MQGSHSPHILELSGNTGGDDYITTDPHGCDSIFVKLLEETLEKSVENRLFIAGDLVDRGPESLQLINRIIAINTPAQRIYMVRGNHEDMVLDALNFLEKFDNDTVEQEIRVCIETLKAFALSGYIYGACENSNKQVTEWEKNIFSPLWLKIAWENLSQKADADDLVSKALRTIENGGGWVFNLSFEERSTVNIFIEALPYVICVASVATEDRKVPAFNIVHAALVSEEALEQAKECGRFTPEQIDYMTWARLQKSEGKTIIDSGVVNKWITYAGHNPERGDHKIYAHINLANLDADTFYSLAALFANHTQCTCRIINVGTIPLPDKKRLDSIVASITNIMTRNKIVFDNPKAVSTFFSLKNTQQTKKIFLQTLTEKISGFSYLERVALAFMLAQNYTNLVPAKVRTWCGGSSPLYSLQTRSMSLVFKILLNDVPRNEFQIEQLPTSTKITFYANAGLTAEVQLTRHRVYPRL